MVQSRSTWIQWINLWNCPSRQPQVVQVLLLRSWVSVLTLDSHYSEDIRRWVEFAASKRVQIRLKLDFKARAVLSAGSQSYDRFLPAHDDVCRLYWLNGLYLRGVDVGDEAVKCLSSWRLSVPRTLKRDWIPPAWETGSWRSCPQI